MAYNISNIPYKSPTSLGYTPPKNVLGSLSPATQALNNKVNPVPAPALTLPKPPAPTAPVKKTITKDSMGNVNETHYDNTTTSKPTTSTGLINTSGGLTNEQKTAGDAFTAKVDNPYKQATSGLINVGNTPNQQAQGYTQQVANTAGGNIALGQKAQDIATQAGQQITDIGQRGANAIAGYKTTGTSPVAEGNAAVTAQNIAAQQAAVAQGANVGLLGTAQALTGQNQAQTGYNEAAGQALTGQGQQITALQGAGTLTQPKEQFGVLTNPVTGEPIGGGTAGSAAFQGGYVQGQQNAGTTAAGMDVANTAATGIKNTITDYINKNPNINPSDLTFGNSVSQWVSGQQLGDPKYQTLFNYLSEYANTLAPILGVGGNVTNMKNQIAQDMINAKASGKSITEVLNNLETLANDKVQNIKSAGQGGGVVAGGGTTTAPTGGSIYSF